MNPERATIETGFARADGAPVLWRRFDGLQPYQATVTAMEERAAAIANGAPEEVWLLEHPALYTAGTSADPGDLAEPDRFPVHRTGRAVATCAPM